MKRLLLIQSRVKPHALEAERRSFEEAAFSLAKFSCLSSLDDTVSWTEPSKIFEGIDGIILGGSGEFDFDGGREESDLARITSIAIKKRLQPLIEYCLKEEMPLLGVCYGHQIVGEVVGVKVMHDPTQKKFGSFEVFLTEEGSEDALFGVLPKSFIAQYGHKDTLSAIPSGAVLLARSDTCKVSALRYGKAIYTVQFHPELTAESLKTRLQNSPGYLPEGVDIDTLIKPSIEASTLIPLFIEKIVR